MQASTQCHKIMKQSISLMLLCVSLAACYSPASEVEPEPVFLESRSGAVERLDPALDALLDVNAQLEVLADGFEWTEGPVWVADEGHLLFSDIPRNTIHKWSEAGGLEVFLRPAGYNRDDPHGKELGTNGLLIDSEGRLVMCNHGLRAISRLNPFDHTHTVLADRYDGKRLNSPNDAVYHPGGDLYFTDPSYGLEGINNSPHKELDFNGVYRLDREGGVTLLTTQMTNPNGIGFSPDASILYVAQSDRETPILRSFEVNEDGTLAEGKLFYDASPQRDAGGKGLPDGMAIDQAGNVFATGPGGVLIISPEGKLLGIIRTGEATANCAFGDDGSTLYITADMYLMRIRLKTKGLGF